jgi:peroxiredoxin
VLGVSLDDKKEPWLNAIHKDGLTWTHVSDLKGWQNEVAQQYGVRVVPTSFLVDKDGKIVAKNLRGPKLQEKLEALLGK